MMTTFGLNDVAAFVNHRLNEMGDHKTLAEIAEAAGFRNTDTLIKIARGDIRLPADRAVKLAEALDVEPDHLLRLALIGWLGDDITGRLFPGGVPTPTFRS
jgi:transcriptional regulator with XRE-family HTH domain